jgi:excinuclease ABC subunit A
MASDQIEIFGAREHNLQVDHLVLPKNALVVLTGPSGSGKSSLAFDTLYAEGQRRYVESLSAYARQFLGRLDRPAVEKLKRPLADHRDRAEERERQPTLDRRHDHRDPRLPPRALRARGHAALPRVRQGRGGPQRRRDRARRARARGRARGGERQQAPRARAAREEPQGRVQGRLRRAAGPGLPPRAPRRRGVRLDEDIKLDKKKKHDLELVVDRVTLARSDRRRIAEAVELGLETSKGEIRVEPEAGEPRHRFSESRQCCGVSYPALSPQSFSFNSPLGMCPKCNGLGTVLEIDPDLIVPDPSLSIRNGAIAAVGHERGARRGLDLPHHRGDGQGHWRRPRRAVEEAPRQAEAPGPARPRGRQDACARGARRARRTTAAGPSSSTA